METIVKEMEQQTVAPQEQLSRQVTVKGGFGYLLLKRLCDIILSFAGIFVMLLPMAIIAIMIKRDSEGPAIFKQERLGKNGKPFVMYKFRSMHLDAEADGPQWAEKEDSRCTKVGLKLRRTRLDELPQLINILKGDMS